MDAGFSPGVSVFFFEAHAALPQSGDGKVEALLLNGSVRGDIRRSGWRKRPAPEKPIPTKVVGMRPPAESASRSGAVIRFRCGLGSGRFDLGRV